MTDDVAALQFLSSPSPMADQGCCAVYSFTTCPGCTVLCSIRSAAIG